MERIKSKTAKRIIGVAVPLLVLIVAIVAVGVSYAWFTEVSTAEVEMLTLTTSSVFDLRFSFNTPATEVLYNGQTALDNDGLLIIPSRAPVESSAAADAYMQDAAFVYATPLRFDTRGATVDMAIHFSKLRIEKTVADAEGNTHTDVLKNFSSDADADRPASAIEYAFTWFIYDAGGLKVYSPFGEISKYSIGADFELTAPEYIWNADAPMPASPAGVKDFVASADDTYWFVVVFAPERIFWNQFSSDETDKSLDEVYTPEEKLIVNDGSDVYPNQVFYSMPTYIGASFSLSATINVVNVRTGEATP